MYELGQKILDSNASSEEVLEYLKDKAMHSDLTEMRIIYHLLLRMFDERGAKISE